MASETRSMVESQKAPKGRLKPPFLAIAPSKTSKKPAAKSHKPAGNHFPRRNSTGTITVTATPAKVTALGPTPRTVKLLERGRKTRSIQDFKSFFRFNKTSIKYSPQSHRERKKR